MSNKYYAFGDSWVSYPIPFVGGGLYDHLATLANISIENDGHAGDSSEQTMGLSKRNRIKSALKDCNILFWSSGGDDFAGEQFVILINNNVDGDINKAINWERANAYFNLIMADYEDLFSLRDSINPNCWIVFHSYSCPPPCVIGKGILTIGPWLQPSLIEQGWTNPSDQSKIVKLLLQELQNRYAKFAATQQKCVYVNTQGFLLPEDWANELHLTSEGWTKLAMVLQASLKKLHLI